MNFSYNKLSFKKSLPISFATVSCFVLFSTYLRKQKKTQCNDAQYLVKFFGDAETFRSIGR